MTIVSNCANARPAVVGTPGNDTLQGGAGADRFDGGAGTDTATDYNPAEGDHKIRVERL